MKRVTKNLPTLCISQLLVCSSADQGRKTLRAADRLGFDLDATLQTLGINRTPFDEINGNVQGFAHQREIAISPIAQLPLKTTFPM
jgi:hypothetical protein